jgi:hypothetical protein
VELLANLIDFSPLPYIETVLIVGPRHCFPTQSQQIKTSERKLASSPCPNLPRQTPEKKCGARGAKSRALPAHLGDVARVLGRFFLELFPFCESAKPHSIALLRHIWITVKNTEQLASFAKGRATPPKKQRFATS